MVATDTCDECGKPESDWDHLEERWSRDDFPSAHPFVRGDSAPPVEKFHVPPASTPRPDHLKEIRTMSNAERAAAPPVIRGDEQPLLCTVCRKPRTNHRGNVGHAFTHPNAGPPKKSRAKASAPAIDSQPKNARLAVTETPRAKSGWGGKRAEPAEEKVHNVISLFSEINAKRVELELLLGQLREMLA